jgi:surface protein
MKKALSQAKIVAIDRNKGRVTLATKNGLVSTGTYLYDINDLKVNMTVLVGKVSGTNVIIEKISSGPKSSSGMSLIKPVDVSPFKFTIDTEKSIPSSLTYILYPYSGDGGDPDYNWGIPFSVDWGDGTATLVTNKAECSHVYSENGIYNIIIRGYGKFNFYWDVSGMLIDIKQWGDYILPKYILSSGNLGGQFAFCTWLKTISALDTPNLEHITSLKFMFLLCSLETITSIERWDISNVTDLSSMFENCSLLVQPLNDWDVSNVTNMEAMFGGWKQTPYSPTFAAYNQPLNNWNVSNVTNMSYMFCNNVAFNQDISMWDVSKVIDMSGMFMDASAFNQSLSNWDVSSVTSMYYMFDHAESFNQPLNSWDVSKVTNMSYMFAYSAFNQPLSNWNTSKVTSMVEMFYDNSAFNQDISMWDISSVTTMENMFKNSAFSTGNYEKLLVGWSAQNVKWNVRFHAGSAQYHAAYAPYKQILLDKGWIITDGGQI